MVSIPEGPKKHKASYCQRCQDRLLEDELVLEDGWTLCEKCLPGFLRDEVMRLRELLAKVVDESPIHEMDVVGRITQKDATQ